METTRKFGSAAGTTYTQEFIETSESEIQAWTDEAATIAQQLGIEMRIQRHGNHVNTQFTSHADQLLFRNLVAHRNNFELHTYTEDFLDNPNDPLRRAWIVEARKVLDDTGIAYDLDFEGHNPVFSFRLFHAAAMFQELRDTGYIDRLAATHLKVNGPPEPGAER